MSAKSSTESSKKRLCERCEAIFGHSTEPQDGELYLHHGSWAALDQAASSGCSMCQALVTEIRTTTDLDPDIVYEQSESKWSDTTELGDANADSCEVALYFLGYLRDQLSQEIKARKPIVSKLHFWLQPSSGTSYFRSPYAGGINRDRRPPRTSRKYVLHCGQW